VRVADVHQYERHVRKVGEKWTEIRRVPSYAIEWHPIGAGVIPAMQLDRKAGLARSRDAVAHEVVFESLTLGHRERLTSGQPPKQWRGILGGDSVVIQASVVGGL